MLKKNPAVRYTPLALRALPLGGGEIAANK